MPSPKSVLPSTSSSSANAKLIKGKTISVGFHSKVRAKDVHEAMEQIFRLSGCTDCGLNGFDMHLHGINPAIQQHFKGIAELNGIENIYVSEMTG